MKLRNLIRKYMSKVTINGVTIEGDFAGNSIVVSGGVLNIDGNKINLPEQKIINVEIHGDAGSVNKGNCPHNI